MDFRSLGSRLGLFAVVVGMFVSPRVATAQYTVQTLQPPSGMPLGTETYVYKINNGGQVLGTVGNPPGIQPTLWTGGVPRLLPLPQGYEWVDTEAYPQLNDNGTVVARLFAVNPPLGLPFASNIAIWQGESVQLLPAAPVSQGGCGGYNDYYPVGLNNSDEVLFWARDLRSTSLCSVAFLWAGPLIPLQFSQVQVPEAPQRGLPAFPCPCQFVSSNHSNSDSHLDDADHISVDLGTRIAGGCSYEGAILAGPNDTTGVTIPVPLASEGGPDGAHAINNHDQVLMTSRASGADDLSLWEGSTLVTDLGPVAGGNGFLNDRGDVLFNVVTGFSSSVGTLLKSQIYTNGGVTDVPIPSSPPGCSYHPVLGTSSTQALALGPHGEIALSLIIACDGNANSMNFALYNNVAVVMTPAPPTPATITWNTPADVAYGTALGSPQLDATANVTGTFTYAPPVGTVLGAGTRSLSVTFTPTDPAYTTATATVNINVLPVALAIKASDATKIFGAPLPAFAASYAGFVNGDSPASLTGTLTLTTAALPTSPVGPYAIMPGGVSSTNYTISLVAGTLMITPAGTTLTLTSNTGSTSYSGETVTFTATPSAVPPGAGTPTGAVTFSDGATVLGMIPLSAGVSTFVSGSLAIGTHVISAQYFGDSNFSGSSNGLTESVLVDAVQLVASATFVKAAGGQYIATITLKNLGYMDANGVKIGSVLNNTGAIDGLTTVPGDLTTGKSVTIFQTFPASSGLSGSVNNALRIQVNWVNGNTSISRRVSLP